MRVQCATGLRCRTLEASTPDRAEDLPPWSAMATARRFAQGFARRHSFSTVWRQGHGVLRVLSWSPFSDRMGNLCCSEPDSPHTPADHDFGVLLIHRCPIASLGDPNSPNADPNPIRRFLFPCTPRTLLGYSPRTRRTSRRSRDTSQCRLTARGQRKSRREHRSLENSHQFVNSCHHRINNW